MTLVDENAHVPALTAERLKALVKALENHGAVQLAYLFGSRATGLSGPLSDIDVGVLLDSALSDSERHSLRKKLFPDLVRATGTLEVDLVDLKDVSDIRELMEAGVQICIDVGAHLIAERDLENIDDFSKFASAVKKSAQA